MRFFYLRNEHGHPIGCLASDLDKTTDTIKYAVSVCNPLDQFNKKQAQALAAGRIAMGDFKLIPVSTYKGKIKTIILKCVVGGNYPHRARDAAKRWLESHKGETN
jgi:hypothetical protein